MVCCTSGFCRYPGLRSDVFIKPSPNSGNASKTPFARLMRSSSDPYVPDGIILGEWVTSLAEGVTAFYDIDTPVTIEALREGSCAYLSGESRGRL